MFWDVRSSTVIFDQNCTCWQGGSHNRLYTWRGTIEFFISYYSINFVLGVTKYSRVINCNIWPELYMLSRGSHKTLMKGHKRRRILQEVWRGSFFYFIARIFYTTFCKFAFRTKFYVVAETLQRDIPLNNSTL